MLDYSQLAKEIERVAPGLFKQSQSLAFLTASMWQEIVDHELFIQRLDELRKEKKELASWQKQLGPLTTITAAQAPYSVCAVDGSQIYPDRHMNGIECFLINVAGCLLTYDKQSKASFFSIPRVFVPDYFAAQQLGFSAELVDLVREEHEFSLLAQKAVEYQSTRMANDFPFVALFDGNLLFWHLDAAMFSVKDLFLKRYCASLELLYQQKIPVAGYLSFSHFHDVVDLMRSGIRADGVLDCLDYEQQCMLKTVLESCTDNELLAHVLQPYQRTTIFYSNVSIVKQYPDHLKPCFVYMHSGEEIVRIEMPLWVAENEKLVDQICAVCVDQCIKGYGYPVALAEAHAQAVVKSADRDFFFHLIYKMAIDRHQNIFPSQKSLKKRIMGI